MQNGYAGDIGDYGKFGFLRALAAAGLRVGINWYLTEPKNPAAGDGKFRIPSGDFFCDPVLAAALDRVYGLPPERRRVAALEAAALLPRGLYFSLPVPGKAGREAWQRQALAALKPAEVVFLDPDNGLTVKSIGPGAKNRVKYCTPGEAADFLSRGQSVVLYNHRQRKPEAAYFAGIQSRLAADPRLAGRAFTAVTFPRLSLRDFILLSGSPEGEARLQAALSGFLAGPFGRHGLCRLPTAASESGRWRISPGG